MCFTTDVRRDRGEEVEEGGGEGEGTFGEYTPGEEGRNGVAGGGGEGGGEWRGGGGGVGGGVVDGEGVN